MGADPVSLYSHIPFCRTRCAYCDFNTYAGLGHLIDPYVTALLQEIEGIALSAPDPLTAHTLYLGGGTPSLLAPEQLQAIVRACRTHCGLTSESEVSLEANPRTLTLDKLLAFRQAGVNRISLGVQSAHEQELRLLGRSHSFPDAAEAFRLARRAGFDNLSVDLIYGLPTQTRRSWRETLDATLAWGPEHLSLYGFTLEPGTPIQRQVEEGRLAEPDPDLAADMYEDARARLDAAGLRQYEISNWAQPGYECRHNRQYWLNRPYLGFGAGAHGAAGDLRYWNVRSVLGYIERMTHGARRDFPLSPAAEGHERIDRPLAMAETMILGLRLVQDGVSKADFLARFGCPPEEAFGQAISELLHLGLLWEDAGALRLAERAYLISNQVFLRFLPDEGKPP